jgi:hypothetical protein
MAYRPYREAVLSGEFVPSERARQVDAILAKVREGGPEQYPEYFQFLGTMGWVMNHPLQSENSLTEHTAWVNSGLNQSYFGGQEAPALNDAGTNVESNPLKNPIGWYWSDSEWLPFYQGETPPANTTVAPTSTKPNAPPVQQDTPVNNNPSTDNTPASDATDSAEENPIGWYWTGSAWLPFYQGEGAPVGATVAPVSTQPIGPPAGWVDPNAPVDPVVPDTPADPAPPVVTPEPEPEPPPPPLYTPRADQFYGGLFTAFDMLNRDGGEINSPFYESAREKVLKSLADQAAADGRTQNTAEEIAMAQRTAPSLPASGLFGMDNYALVNGLYT